MIDITVEQVIRIGEAPRYIPGRPHIASVYRWLSRSTNPLETLMVGGRRFTSVEALYRFIERCNPSATLPTPMAGRERQIERAEAELTRAGI
jgi:hypothetical protein